jgi:hypothetical protein
MSGPLKSLLPAGTLELHSTESNASINIDKIARKRLPDAPMKIPEKKYTMKKVVLLPKDLPGFDKYPEAIEMWYDLVAGKGDDDPCKYVHKQTRTRPFRTGENAAPKKKKAAAAPKKETPPKGEPNGSDDLTSDL